MSQRNTTSVQMSMDCFEKLKELQKFWNIAQRKDTVSALVETAYNVNEADIIRMKKKNQMDDAIKKEVIASLLKSKVMMDNEKITEKLI